MHAHADHYFSPCLLVASLDLSWLPLKKKKTQENLITCIAAVKREGKDTILDDSTWRDSVSVSILGSAH